MKNSLILLFSLFANVVYAQNVDSSINKERLIAPSPPTESDREEIIVSPGYTSGIGFNHPIDEIPIKVSGSTCRRVDYTIFHTFKALFPRRAQSWSACPSGCGSNVSYNTAGLGHQYRSGGLWAIINGSAGPNLVHSVCYTQTIVGYDATTYDLTCDTGIEYTTFSGSFQACPGQTKISYRGIQFRDSSITHTGDPRGFMVYKVN